MKRSARLLSLFLALALTLSPFAQALTLTEAKDLLAQTYIDELPQAAQDAQTIDALIAALGDPYTQYFTPAEYAGFMASMEDTVNVGLGLRFQMTQQGGMIDKVYPGGGAAAAGIVAGDLILAIGNTPIPGKTVEEIQPLLAGKEGATLSLKVKSQAGVTKTLTLTFAPYTIPATDVELLDGHLGVITCDTFGGETYGHFKDAIVANDPVVDRWIVDLRSNGGGELQAAVDAASAFAGSGQLAFLRDGSDQYGAYDAAEASLTMDPVLVLVGDYTASAAELFAATIRDTQAGVLIGNRTYGKGVAQVVLDKESHPDLFADGSALKVTAYRAFSAGHITHDRMGVLPHVVVAPEYAPDVAYLLSASRPTDSEGFLRVHVGGWRLYVNLEVATDPSFLPAFTALLEGLAPSISLYSGTGSSTWVQTSVPEVAAQYAKDYVNPSFSDLDRSGYADAIHTLATFGIVAGGGDGTYQPKTELNRASLCALLAKAMGYPETPGESTFADVPSDEWYTPYVNTLTQLGIVNGWDDGLFHPEAPMNHEQFMVILSRTTQYISQSAHAYALEGVPADVLNGPDYANYSAWARPDVSIADGLYYDAASAIDPLAATTREEAAASLYTMLTAVGVLAL